MRSHCVEEAGLLRRVRLDIAAVTQTRHEVSIVQGGLLIETRDT